MPVLKFFVGGNNKSIWENTALLLPDETTVLANNEPIIFSWRELPEAAMYRLEILEDSKEILFSAILPSTQNIYRSPSWLVEKFGGKKLSWRIVALDEEGNTKSQTTARLIKF